MRCMPMAFVCAAAVYAQAGGALRSIDDLVDAALRRNGEYLAALQRIQEARGLLRQAGVRPSTTVEAELANGRVLGSGGEAEYTAGFFQPIETGGKRDRRIDSARIGI